MADLDGRWHTAALGANGQELFFVAPDGAMMAVGSIHGEAHGVRAAR